MCRCTGYQNIVRTIEAAAADPRVAQQIGGGR
jgi:aerobic-type carbon monoxide dehydrogenase small subunit (CoxS/CutS family)